MQTFFTIIIGILALLGAGFIALGIYARRQVEREEWARREQAERDFGWRE